LTLQQQLNQAKLAKKGSAMKWVTISVVVVVLGVAGYFGYIYFSKRQPKQAEAAKETRPVFNSPADLAAWMKNHPGAARPDGAPAEPPPPPKELPLLPAVWTLDADQAKIPEGRANGAICGTNFVVETARLDKIGTAYLLRLLQGAPASPDLGFMIYLHTEAGESVTGHTWTVSQDMTGKAVPQVVRLLKTNPRYQAQAKNIFSGYAMKLELGQITNGVIPGRIFLAVPPDTEQSVVAGVFKANTSLANAAGAAAANPVAAPNPPPSAAYQRRYGKKQ
jgi:hypothetical protein